MYIQVIIEEILFTHLKENKRKIGSRFSKVVLQIHNNLSTQKSGVNEFHRLKTMYSSTILHFWAGLPTYPKEESRVAANLIPVLMININYIMWKIVDKQGHYTYNFTWYIIFVFWIQNIWFLLHQLVQFMKSFYRFY